jgi:uncharacterized protein YdhG (YjbR/CyaY superfamily)
MTGARFATIDAYVAQFPADVRKVLQRIRATIRRAAPAAAETISYNMPAFRSDDGIVYFGTFKKHIGIFPPVKDAALQNRTRKYRGEKGNLQFPFDQPMDYVLIADIAKSQLRPLAGKRAAEPAKTKKEAQTLVFHCDASS